MDLRSLVLVRELDTKVLGWLTNVAGREDSFSDAGKAREVRTTGWVVVRFTPRPTGIR